MSHSSVAVIAFVQGTAQELSFFLQALQYQNHSWLGIDVYLITPQLEKVQAVDISALPFRVFWVLSENTSFKAQLTEVLTHPLAAHCIITTTQCLPQQDWLKHFMVWQQHANAFTDIGFGNREYFPQDKQTYFHQALDYLKATGPAHAVCAPHSFYTLCLPLQALKSLAVNIPDLPIHQTLHDWILFYLAGQGYRFTAIASLSYLPRENLNTYVEQLKTDAQFLAYYCHYEPLFIQFKHPKNPLFKSSRKALQEHLHHLEQHLPRFLKHLHATAFSPVTAGPTLYRQENFQRLVKHVLSLHAYYQTKALASQHNTLLTHRQGHKDSPAQSTEQTQGLILLARPEPLPIAQLSLKNFCRSLFFPILKPQEKPLFELPSFVDFEIANTTFVHNSLAHPVYNTLTTLCSHVPHHSSLAIGAILHQAVAHMPRDQVFVSLGVAQGFSLIAGLAHHPGHRGIGIEHLPHQAAFIPVQHSLEAFGIQNAQIFQEDFDTYLTHHQGAIGVFYYDASPDPVQLLKALEQVEPFLKEGSVIIINHLNEEGMPEAIHTFVNASVHPYTTIFSQTTATNQHPSLWNGLHILEQRPPSRDFLPLLEQQPCWDARAEYTFKNGLPMGDYLLQNRTELLAFCEWINAHDIRSYLEIGIWTGRLLSVLEELFHFDKLAACDLGLLKAHNYPMHIPPKTQMYWGNSQSQDYLQWRATLGHMDLIMIDADHSYEGVKQDFLLNTQHAFKYIAFHDVVNTHPSAIGVKQFWNELQGNKVTFAFPNLACEHQDSGMGIGIWWP